MVVRSAPGESVAFRALRLLDAFDEQHRVLSMSEVARRAGVPVATAHRRLQDLVDGRLVARRPDGRFEVGARMWHLGQLSRPTALRETALPHLQDLVAFTGHTAHVAVLDGIGALVVDRISGSRTLPTRHQPGGRLELHCTAVGKALLAFADEQLVAQALQMLAPVTPYTITDPRVMRTQLAEIRRTRLAPSRQEHRVSTTGLGVPVFSGRHVVAAVGLVAPLDASLRTAVEPLQRCAAAIGAAIVDRERRLDGD
ncbi:transcriptional regulator, IclR family [Klenkia soli]|uniref:Transcriptional regulator, IclR family n=1 Tax=Klenkia soli TaxID=1052260 RepID=A0A1H0FY36_9ACTN|nr:IclR family transcriptional regulator [Klenkia soli]SDN99399.1 transcriptional regulator, IclR family [Klenkia soli]